MSATHARRSGFTTAEMLVALLVLAAIMVVVAQVVFWSVRERARQQARLAALEAAENVLERARAVPWPELTPAWAQTQRLPTTTESVLPDKARLTVRVEPDTAQPRLRRVSAEVRWSNGADRPDETVRLVGVFGARTAKTTEGAP